MRNLQLREYKQIIRDFIRTNWSDVKVAEVYAFNADGKMTYHSSCGCILGVTLANVLHTDSETGQECTSYHYAYAQDIPGAAEVEWAYRWLSPSNEGRKRLLSPILRFELHRRGKLALSQSQEASESSRQCEEAVCQ